MARLPSPDGTPGDRSPWRTIGVLYLAGVVGAMNLGKYAPVGPAVAADLGLSLARLGWIISAALAVGAVVGLPAGYAVRRIGAERSLVIGLVLTALAGAAALPAGGFGWALAARVVEGAGFLLIIVACPALMIRLAHGRDRGVAMSLWATYVPTGIGLSTLAGGLLGEALGWRGWIGVMAALSLLAAVAARPMLPPPAADGGLTPAARPGAADLRGPVLLSAGFCLMVLIAAPVVALLPTYLIEEHGWAAGPAGAATSIISLFGVPGGLAAGVLLRRGVRPAALVAAGVIMLPAAWPAYGIAGSAAASITGAAVISLASGLLGAVVFAVLPMLLARLDHADVGNGVVAQMGSLGSLLGAPLFGLVANSYGWPALVPVSVLCLAAALALLFPLARRAS
ncbi:hypothetical protein Sru01_45240 [Sphaerisporangium rufum]|uniref:Major facilitator superfamily (MFS) profile domain-containing protein n=1 Tax=Sphaerisporangium rufum TaxID=1381558 RepID=A0A919V2C0_9ACTN|nr:MFS transporter [Sphaerisporangium rufum]GII79542.1 hypothetical protein Sru01_45240 [Sphaerisporangium rufum]